MNGMSAESGAGEYRHDHGETDPTWEARRRVLTGFLKDMSSYADTAEQRGKARLDLATLHDDPTPQVIHRLQREWNR